jgi:hypothetical protein
VVSYIFNLQWQCPQRLMKPTEFKRCVSCRWALYCSKACQSQDFPIHRPLCQQAFRSTASSRRLERQNGTLPNIDSHDHVPAFDIAFGKWHTHELWMSNFDSFGHPELAENGQDARAIRLEAATTIKNGRYSPNPKDRTAVVVMSHGQDGEDPRAVRVVCLSGSEFGHRNCGYYSHGDCACAWIESLKIWERISDEDRKSLYGMGENNTYNVALIFAMPRNEGLKTIVVNFYNLRVS